MFNNLFEVLMKKIIIVAVLFLCHLGHSQNSFSGIVAYTIEPAVDFNPTGIKKDKDMNPKEKDDLIEILSEPAYFVMEFTANESVYQSEGTIMKSDSDKRIKISFLQIFGGMGIFYSNSKEKLTLNQRDAFGELVLISSSFPDWEVTGETKKVGDFICYKAIKKISSAETKTIAWFTPQIPVQFGPGLYNGLPGLVLEVQVGKIRVFASKIKLDTPDIVIEKPIKGATITHEEYTKKVKEIADEIGF